MSLGNRPPYWRLKAAVSTLEKGGVIAYPTEAVWGLGCDPYNADAVQRLLALKQRKMDKGLILVAAYIDQLGGLLENLNPGQLARLQAVPAQPTTWLIPHHELIPSWISGVHSTVAVRISRHPAVQGLCHYFGGMLVSTSANAAGLPAARTQLKARGYFGTGVDVYVPGAVGKRSAPSTIIDLVKGNVLR